MSKRYPKAKAFAGTTEIERQLNKSHPIEDVAAPKLAKPANFRRKSNLLSVAVCAVVLPGLFATVALPAYGASVVPGTSASSTSAFGSAGTSSGSTAPQALSIGSSATVSNGIQRGVVKYVAPRRPTLQPWSALPAHFGSVNLSGVAKIAARYLGVPYKFGGESPAGFDCSGLVEYVYAQVGIRLPHSAAEQGRLGHRVSLAAAVPGDVVVMNGGSHVGIYIGGDEMIDAPYPGRRVSVDKIYDNDYYIVRF